MLVLHDGGRNSAISLATVYKDPSLMAVYNSACPDSG